MPTIKYKSGNNWVDVFNSKNDFTYLGVNITGSTANDTREFWMAQGSGYANFNATGKLNGQPSQWGFLLNFVIGTEIHQEFWVQSNGLHYKRGVNSSATDMPSWYLSTYYPVGAVYISYDTTSPATLFGGSWTQMTGDKFLRMGQSTNTGGSNNHRHWVPFGMKSGETTAYIGAYTESSSPASRSISNINRMNIGTSSTVGIATGTTRETSTYTENNIPEWQMLYAWRKTA